MIKETEIRNACPSANLSVKIGDKYVATYHGGSIIVSEASFDFRNEKPPLASETIGYNTPNGVYYFKRECSNARNLECLQIQVLRDGAEETAKLRRKVEDGLRKHTFMLAKAVAVLF